MWVNLQCSPEGGRYKKPCDYQAATRALPLVCFRFALHTGKAHRLKSVLLKSLGYDFDF